MTAQERITEWAELADAATEGPWTPAEDWAAIAHGPDSVAHGYYKGDCPSCGDFIEDDAFVAIDPADAAFVAASRTAVPTMAAALTAVLELHRPCDNGTNRTPVCENCHGKAGVHSCGCWADHDRQPVCATCNEGFKFIRVEWPCPTVVAIETALEVTP